MAETEASTYYDRLEVRDAYEREQVTFNSLPGLIRHALDNAPFFKTYLAGTEPDQIIDRASLAALPILRKAELMQLQTANRPFGGLNATPLGRLAKIFASPGPIYEPEGARVDYWRFARALYAAGFRHEDIVHNSFSYHLTPAGSIAESGARALGCSVIPGGTGQSDAQVRVINDLEPTGYIGTPSFLLILADKARELGLSIASIRKALVSGEAFPPATRQRLADNFGIDAYQAYASADLGLIAYETSSRAGLVVDEAVILEIVRPGTGEPVPEGEVGEVVVTVFNPDYPLIRFATGDLSAVLPGESPCGRTNMRITGWMGRADQSTKVRGLFVHPHQIARVIEPFEAIGKARLTVDRHEGQDEAQLACECRTPGHDGLAERLADGFRTATGLRCAVVLVDQGSLPNDGKVIDDRRPAG